MYFNYNDYKELLYAVAWCYEECIINIDVIQPYRSYHNTDLTNKLIAMGIPEIDYTLKGVRLSEISNIWELLQKVEDNYCQKTALDILADFANLYQEEFGCESMVCASGYLKCRDVGDITMQKLVRQHFAKEYLKDQK